MPSHEIHRHQLRPRKPFLPHNALKATRAGLLSLLVPNQKPKGPTHWCCAVRLAVCGTSYSVLKASIAFETSYSGVSGPPIWDVRPTSTVPRITPRNSRTGLRKTQLITGGCGPLAASKPVYPTIPQLMSDRKGNSRTTCRKAQPNSAETATPMFASTSVYRTVRDPRVGERGHPVAKSRFRTAPHNHKQNVAITTGPACDSAWPRATGVR